MVSGEQPSLPRRVAQGAAVGSALGLALVAVGFVRFAFFLLTGGRTRPNTETETHTMIRVLSFYVGGFAVGGALFGAMRPLLRGRTGVYIGCMIAGVIVTFAVLIADRETFGTLPWPFWILFAALGMIFGSAFAYGWTRPTR